MPITGIYSYLSTADAFDDHWQSVNAARPNAPVVLPDGLTLAGFQTLKSAMKAAFGAVVPAANGERQLAGRLGIERHDLQPRFGQFNQSVRLYLGRSRFAKATVEVPGINNGEQVYREAGEKVSASWGDINGATDLTPFVPPLLLPDFDVAGDGSYALAAFEAQLAGLLADFGADATATRNATQKRADRNALLPAMHDAIKAYRDTCLLVLPPDSPLLVTLPRLTPEPGTTPGALTVRGQWQEAAAMALLEWEKSGAKDLLKLQVRGCLGGTYKGNEEEIVADLPAEATRWSGDWGLTAPGSIASFKVYVMTKTGNENGGKSIKIVRPATE